MTRDELLAERRCTLAVLDCSTDDIRPLDSLVSEALAQRENDAARQREALLACLGLLERLSVWVDPDCPTPFWAACASPRQEITEVMAKVREVLKR